MGEEHEHEDHRPGVIPFAVWLVTQVGFLIWLFVYAAQEFRPAMGG